MVCFILQCAKVSWSHNTYIVLNKYGFWVLGFTSPARLRYCVFLSEAVIGSRQMEEKWCLWHCWWPFLPVIPLIKVFILYTLVQSCSYWFGKQAGALNTWCASDCVRAFLHGRNYDSLGERMWRIHQGFCCLHCFISTQGQHSDQNQFIYNCINVKYISVWKHKQAH